MEQTDYQQVRQPLAIREGSLTNIERRQLRRGAPLTYIKIH